MNDERLNEIKTLVSEIEKIYHDKWKKEEFIFLLESLYGRCDIDELIEEVERLKTGITTAIEHTHDDDTWEFLNRLLQGKDAPDYRIKVSQ